jgi:hypothetical protein
MIDPTTAQKSALFTAALFSSPTERYVIPNAIPIAARRITIGPRVGFRNHLVALITDRNIEFMIKTPLNISSTLFLVPLKIAAQKNPAITLAKIIDGSEI